MAIMKAVPKIKNILLSLLVSSYLFDSASRQPTLRLKLHLMKLSILHAPL